MNIVPNGGMRNGDAAPLCVSATETASAPLDRSPYPPTVPDAPPAVTTDRDAISVHTPLPPIPPAPVAPPGPSTVLAEAPAPSATRCAARPTEPPAIVETSVVAAPAPPTAGETAARSASVRHRDDLEDATPPIVIEQTPARSLEEPTLDHADAATAGVAEEAVAIVRPRRRRLRPALIAAIFIVTALIAAVVIVLSTRDDGADPSGRQAAVSTAPASTAASIVPSSSDPSAAATPAPAPVERRVRARSFESVCKEGVRRAPCDGDALARWDGDLGAWQAFASLNGQVLPDTDGALAQALQMRMAAFDPPTRIAAATALGTPAVLLASASITPDAGTNAATLEVEVVNLGSSAADLSGARLIDGNGTTLLALPAGATLAPGARCRIDPGPATTGRCPFEPSVLKCPAAAAVPALVLVDAGDEPIDVLD